MRYFFHIGYNGFNYRGWQRMPQTDGANVQQLFEEQLTRILKTPIAIVGCGRTDSQVHAAQFFFHTDTDASWDYDLIFRLNKNLPDDVAAFDLKPVHPSAHARFDANSRTYNYFIHTRKDPYLSQVSAYYPERQLDLHKMQAATNILTSYDDYRPFSKNVPAGNSTICRVSSARLFADDNTGSLRFEITSNRFLNGMIRIIVNKLIDIGCGKLSVNEWEDYLATRTKPAINRLAYPQGLYLSRVNYPYMDLPPRPAFFRSMTEGRNWVEV